jgi:hypothetical protein
MLLRYPCYGLFHLESLAESETGGYSYDIVPTFASRFSAVEQQQIRSALDEAIGSATIDWEGILPDLPGSDDFKRQHLRLTRTRLEQP